MIEKLKYTDEDRTHWEAKKLEAEARELSRSPILKPGFWFSGITTFVAIFGIVAQYFASDITYKKADNENKMANALREQAELKITQAKNHLEEVERNVIAKQAELDNLTEITHQLDELRAKKDKEIALIGEMIDRIKHEKIDGKLQVAKLEQSYQQLQRQQEQAHGLAKEQNKLINKLGGKKAAH